MAQEPAYNGFKGMCAWERELLGWIKYTTVRSDTTATLTDYMSTGKVLKIPIDTTFRTEEFFIIENRQKISQHDYAGGDNNSANGQGIYIYHITPYGESTAFPPKFDIECADGNFDFIFNQQTRQITKGAPNRNGKDEMNYFYTTPNYEKYYCRVPDYSRNAVWGDQWDAFTPQNNNIFSPYSNPASTNSTNKNFFVETLSSGTNAQVKINFNNTQQLPVSKPMGLYVTQVIGTGIIQRTNNTYYNITWLANTEPFITGYEIYRRTGNWQLIGTVSASSASFTDYDLPLPNVYTRSVREYKVRALGTNNRVSLYSDPRPVDRVVYQQGTGPNGNNPSENLSQSDNNIVFQAKDIATENKIENYPNPFNPATTISYSVKDAGQVIIKIFNSLGQEIKELVNEYKNPGQYTVQFNGNSLSSGVYYYQIIANGYSDTKKMQLIK